MSANTLATKTMNGLVVIPKMAGIESKAKITSVTASETSTSSMGVSMRFMTFLPPSVTATVVRSLMPL